MIGYLIVDNLGRYWKRPSAGVTDEIREAHIFSLEEMDRQKPVFGFWNSHAIPVGNF